MQIAPVQADEGVLLALPEGRRTILGRRKELKVHNLRVSKHHADLEATGNVIRLIPHKAVYIVRDGQSEASAVACTEPVEMAPGDSVYLVRREGGRLQTGFLATTAAPISTPSKHPQRRISGGAATPSAQPPTSPAVARAPTTPLSGSKRSAAQTQATPAAKRRAAPVGRSPLSPGAGPSTSTALPRTPRTAAAAAATLPDADAPTTPVAPAVAALGVETPAAPPAPDHGLAFTDAPPAEGPADLFRGLRVVFWTAPGSWSSARCRDWVTQHGGELQDAVTAETTHVVASFDLTEAEVEQRLATGAASGHGDAREGARIAWGQSSDGRRSRLPLAPPAFVRPSWIEDSVRLGHRAPESEHRLYLGLQDRLEGLTTPQEVPPPQSAGHVLVMQVVRETSEAQWRRHPSGLSISPGEPPRMPPLEEPGGSDAAPAVEVEVFSEELQRFVPPASAVLLPGMAWGEEGRWIEPYEEAAARDACDKLRAHWHGQHPPPGGGADASPADTSYQTQLRSGGQHEDGAGGRINGVCLHVACGSRPFCIITELERLRDSYNGRADEFRRKAIVNAIHTLQGVTKPLQDARDVAELRLGAKTTDKIVEVLQTGRLARNEVIAADEGHCVRALFARVWGCAEKTAQLWFSAGCRSLEDVQRLPSLTEVQLVGLKHFAAFEQRIPRAEVAEAQAIVAQHFLDALSAVTGKPIEALTDRLHARVMGSFLRGRVDCGDIDFILAPSPAAGSVELAPLMGQLLRRLSAAGVITDDLKPAGGWTEYRRVRWSPSSSRQGSCTWLGVWRGPSSPCVRRVDLKIYPWQELPFAVNYFASGQGLCRALRYWANTPPQADVLQRIHALNPKGNCFKLTDSELVVRWRPPKRGVSRQRDDDDVVGPAGAEEVVGPQVVCESETDIFAAVGLPYVPPHMRDLIPA